MLIGNLTASVFYLIFQVCGISLSFLYLKDKQFLLKLLSGSVFGTVLFQWLPCIFALIFGFGLTSHFLALAVVLAVTFPLSIIYRKNYDFKIEKPSKLLMILTGFIYIILVYLIFHGFRINENGMNSSQATFGDMNMHLGFITSIAKQKEFPPMYSIYPQEQLSYPFLSDSISSSIYVFGASLRFSYIFPMLFACAQVIGGFVLFMKIWLCEKWKVALATVFFFLNGGFGFVYFLNEENIFDFNRIFTSFYETPTNLTSQNIRWVNILVDMLLPQRATLFGWAVLFTALSLLLMAVKTNERKFFMVTGVFAGALPMIHTHSFLALAMVSVAWGIVSLGNKLSGKIKALLISFPLFMFFVQLFSQNNREAKWLLPVCLIIVAILIAFGLISAFKKKFKLETFYNWLVYLIITLALAVPQLIKWTFSQAQGSQFTRGYFNWANINHNYFEFYIINIGVLAVLFLPAALKAKNKILSVASPIILIMLVSEMIVFQPNVYDNNKLILIAYFFACGMVSDFVVNYLRKTKFKVVLSVILVFLCTFSAALTIIRETKASYQLYGKETLEFTEFVENETSVNSTFLTSSRHNNEVATLTGRNIVMGSSSYLYYHGIDYVQTEEEVRAMLEEPQNSLELFQKNNVDYILLTAYELNDYNVDTEMLNTLFKIVYSENGITLYEYSDF